MEMLNVSGNTYIFKGPTTIGLYVDGSEGTIIDTGIDENAVRKIYNMLNEKGIQIRNVINTHSHADHIGGNAFLEKKGNVKFHASEMEATFIKYPELFSGYLFGSDPPKFMVNKFIMAEPTKNVDISFPNVFKMVDLSGHSWGMVGVITKDDVLFCADSVYSEDIVNKHPLLFHINTMKFREKMVKLLDYESYKKIISHGGEVNSIKSVVERNLKALDDVIEMIMDFLPDYRENIYSKLLEKIGVRSTWEYYLNSVPFQAIIAFLENEKRLEFSIKEGRIFLDKR